MTGLKFPAVLVGWAAGDCESSACPSGFTHFPPGHVPAAFRRGHGSQAVMDEAAGPVNAGITGR